MQFPLLNLLLTPTATRPSCETTFSVLLPGLQPQPLVASVITANPTMTSLHIACATGVDDFDCEGRPAIDVEHVSDSVWYAIITDYYTYSWGCTVNTHKTEAVCVASVYGGTEAPTKMTVTATDTNEIQMLPVTVTAGQDKLCATPVAVGSD